MVKYKIIESDAKVEGEPMIEVRLIEDAGEPTLQIRNTGRTWFNLVWLREDGGMGLGLNLSQIKGLLTDTAGGIKTF